MSTNCLFKKLKGTISADLEKYGELLYKVPSSAVGDEDVVFSIGLIPHGVISIEGDLELWDFYKTTNYGSSYTNPNSEPDTTSLKIVVNGAGTIRVTNKYNLTFDYYSYRIYPTKYDFDMKSISCWWVGRSFITYNFGSKTSLNRCPLTGAFSEINYKNLPLKTIDLTYTSVTGDLSDFAQYADTLETLSATGTPITGNIASLGQLTHLKSFNGYKLPGSPQLEGSIEEFVAAQRTAGRETASNITMYLHGNNNCYFNGAKITTGSVNNLSWTATTITFNGVTITA